MAEHEVDHIGQEAAAMMKTMLQLATLVALRTRERGQKEAEARVKLTQARLKEARELAARQMREAKAHDPRNAELQRMLARNGVVLSKNRAEPSLERIAERAVRLERSATATLERTAQAEAPPVQPAFKFDSAERRAALALELAELGVAPELIEIRMLAEMSQSKPVAEMVRDSVDSPAQARAREREKGSRARELYRER